MATEIAKAYVQIVPTTKGIKGQLTQQMGGEAETAGKSSGESFGNKFASTAKKIIAAAGIGKMISGAINASADYEQLTGGVEKLFGDSADTLMEYANQAYKTAGVSANAYMENVTSFSAALIGSLGGDTEAAVGYADQAIRDMSDNANTFGTDITSIQNAYQGFAKGNFTMLDNLKLGYGGTKTEMERLLRDAEQMEGFMTGSLSVDNFVDIVTAIGIVQDQMNITGTTAREAEGTYSGSLAAMKAAFENFQASLGSGENMEASLSSLVSTAGNYLENNLLPLLTNILSTLPTSLLQGIAELAPTIIQSGSDTIANLLTGLTEAMPTLIPAATTAITTIVTGLTDNIPQLTESAIGMISALASGLMAALPTLIDSVPTIITNIVSKLSEMSTSLIEAGVALFVSIIEDLPTIIQQIVDALPQIIDSVVNALIDNIEVIAAAGVQLFVALVGSLPEIIMSIVGAVPQIMTAIKDAFAARWEEMKSIGLDLFEGLKSGIADKINSIANEVNAWASDFVSGIKNFFGIHSPSTVFADIGENLMLGLEKGLDEAKPAVAEAMDDINGMTTDKMQSSISVSAAGVDSIMRSSATVNARSVAESREDGIFDSVYNGVVSALRSADFGGEFNLYLEGDKLVSYVTRKQRQTVRAMGV